MIANPETGRRTAVVDGSRPTGLSRTFSNSSRRDRSVSSGPKTSVVQWGEASEEEAAGDNPAIGAFNPIRQMLTPAEW
jgi:hypothetical protein